MRMMKWVGLVAALGLIVSCFLPWVRIDSISTTVTGVSAPGTNFGKPGYFHLIAVGFFICFTLVPKVWAKRSNLLVTALNMAWSIRNFLLIPMCHGGECPQKKLGIFLVVVASSIMLISSLLPDFNPDRKRTIQGD